MRNANFGYSFGML